MFIYDDDNIWSALEHDNELMDNGALDAHWGAENLRFWSEENFGRNSYDDNGARY
jgi:hypothetical protein